MVEGVSQDSWDRERISFSLSVGGFLPSLFSARTGMIRPGQTMILLSFGGVTQTMTQGTIGGGNLMSMNFCFFFKIIKKYFTFQLEDDFFCDSLACHAVFK